MSAQFPFAEQMERDSRALLLLEQMAGELREIKRLLTRRELDRFARSSPSIQHHADGIKQVVASYYGTSAEALDSHERADHVVLARHMAARFVKELLHVSDRELDRLFNRQNHFSANSRVSLNARLETNERVREDRAKLAAELERLWFGKNQAVEPSRIAAAIGA